MKSACDKPRIERCDLLKKNAGFSHTRSHLLHPALILRMILILIPFVATTSNNAENLHLKTYASTATSMVTGNPPVQPRPNLQTRACQAQSSKSVCNQYVSFGFSDSMLYEEIYVFLNQIAYLEKMPSIIGKGVKGSLSKHNEFWVLTNLFDS
jgi:hypothetical protein